MRLRMKAGIGTLAVTAVLAFSKCSGPLNDRLPEKAVAAEPANAPAETKAAQTQEKPKEEHAAKPKKEPCPKVVHEPDERCGIDRPYKKDKVPTMSELKKYERARIRANIEGVRLLFWNLCFLQIKLDKDVIRMCAEPNDVTITFTDSEVRAVYENQTHIWKIHGKPSVGIQYIQDSLGEDTIWQMDPGPPFYGAILGRVARIHLFTDKNEIITFYDDLVSSSQKSN